MDDREEARRVIDDLCGIYCIRVCATGGPPALPIEEQWRRQATEKLAGHLERIRAEAKAEVLRDAAERAYQYVATMSVPTPSGVKAAILFDHTPDAGKRAEDVDTVREAIDALGHAASCGYAMSRMRREEIEGEAIAALDRIVGVLRGSV